LLLVVKFADVVEAGQSGSWPKLGPAAVNIGATGPPTASLAEFDVVASRQMRVP
jgi:hypothetical protein